MTPQEQAERDAVVAEARSWIGTPYHHCADVKGAGVDCGMILVRVFADCGLIDPFDPRPYAPDWMKHREEEIYLDIVRRLTRVEFDPRLEVPGAGDVVVWKHGKTYSHGAIVTDWPYVVHAFADAGRVEEIDVTHTPLMKLGNGPRPMLAFSVWDEAL